MHDTHPPAIGDNAPPLSDKLNVRSEMAQDIISHKPTALERYSLLLYGAILLLILAASCFIKYPETIETGVKLTAVNGPKEIIPHSDGRLIELFVHNDETVQQDQQIGWLESLADHSEVKDLAGKVDTCIARFYAGRLIDCSRLFNKRYYRLGELETAWQSFIPHLQQFNDNFVNGFYERKLRYLQHNIPAADHLHNLILAQINLVHEDFQLANETLEMNRSLFDQKVIPDEELRTVRSRFIGKKLALPQLEAALVENDNQKISFLKDVDQLRHDMTVQRTEFELALQALKAAIGEWQQKYTLTAPTDGKITLGFLVQKRQFLNAGKVIGYVSPANTHYVAEAYLPQTNFGKIDTGLNVQLRFDAYPYQEFGVVVGHLSYISKVADENGFLTTVTINDQLLTNNNRIIPYKSGLHAQAIIITRDVSILKRLYFDIVKKVAIQTK